VGIDKVQMFKPWIRTRDMVGTMVSVRVKIKIWIIVRIMVTFRIRVRVSAFYSCFMYLK